MNSNRLSPEIDRLFVRDDKGQRRQPTALQNLVRPRPGGNEKLAAVPVSCARGSCDCPACQIHSDYLFIFFDDCPGPTSRPGQSIQRCGGAHDEAVPRHENGLFHSRNEADLGNPASEFDS